MLTSAKQGQQQQQLLDLGLKMKDVEALQSVPTSYELHRKDKSLLLRLFKKKSENHKHATVSGQPFKIRNCCAAMRVIEIIKHAFDTKIRTVYEQHTNIALEAIADEQTRTKLKDIYDHDATLKYDIFKKALYDVLKLSAVQYDENCRTEKKLFEDMYKAFALALTFASVDFDKEVQELLAKELKLIAELDQDISAFSATSQSEIPPIRKMVNDFFNNVQLMDNILRYNKTVSPVPRQNQTSPLPLRLTTSSNLVSDKRDTFDPTFLPLQQSCNIEADNSKTDKEPTTRQRSNTFTN